MKKKVAYITSGKIGIHRFTYNELIELKKLKVDFILCLTQLKNGPWMPNDEWNVLIASKKGIFLSFIRLIFYENVKLFMNLIKSIRMGVFPYFMLAIFFYNNLKNKEISSIHCQMGDKKLYIGYFLKKFIGLPLTVTIHAHELYQREVYDKPNKMKWLFSQCDKIITISDFNKDILMEKLKLSEKMIEVMRLFPDESHIDEYNSKKKILIVANWTETKGYKILLESIKRINREDFIVWAVGGSYFSKDSFDLAKLIKKYKLEDRIVIMGRLKGELLSPLFSSCDFFCLPAQTKYMGGDRIKREGIPVSLMEAMAWGKPVISTYHAGIPELVEEVLVKENDVDELKEAIEYLLDHPEKWAEMGKRNQEIIRKKYTPENVKILSDIFKQLSN